MKFLKFSRAVAFSSLFVIALSSCKKDNEPSAVKKEQLLGKWDMVLQTGSTVQQVHVVLKGSGAMELDVSPYDGVTDLIFLWNTENNNFKAHLDADAVANYYEMNGTIDAGTLGISGQLKINDPQSPQTSIFLMDKQN